MYYLHNIRTGSSGEGVTCTKPPPPPPPPKTLLVSRTLNKTVSRINRTSQKEKSHLPLRTHLKNSQHTLTKQAQTSGLTVIFFRQKAIRLLLCTCHYNKGFFSRNPRPITHPQSSIKSGIFSLSWYQSRQSIRFRGKSTGDEYTRHVLPDTHKEKVKGPKTPT